MASKHQRREYQLAAQLQTAIRIARHDDWEQHPGWDKVTHPDIPRRPEGSQTHDEWTEALKEQRAGAKKRLDSLRKEEKREHSKRVRLKWQREYPNRMRQGNKEIFRDEDAPELVAAQHPDKGLVTSPDDITEAFTLQTQKLFTPTLPKEAGYNTSAPPNHPWTPGWTPGSQWAGAATRWRRPPDQFNMRSPRQRPHFKNSLEHRLTRSLYDDRVRMLKNKKAPGPDGMRKGIITLSITGRNSVCPSVRPSVTPWKPRPHLRKAAPAPKTRTPGIVYGARTRQDRPGPR